MHFEIHFALRDEKETRGKRSLTTFNGLHVKLVSFDIDVSLRETYRRRYETAVTSAGSSIRRCLDKHLHSNGLRIPLSDPLDCYRSLGTGVANMIGEPRPIPVRYVRTPVAYHPAELPQKSYWLKACSINKPGVAADPWLLIVRPKFRTRYA